MKKISKELYKNYFFIISIVVIIYLVPIYYIASYQYSYTRQEIYNVATFLETEFSEPEHKDLAYFLSEVFKESPEISNISIIITNNSITFKDKHPPDLGPLPLKDKIQYYNLEYWVLNKRIVTEYNGVIEIRIIKELSSLIFFFKNLFFISSLMLLVLLFLCIKIMNRFYNSFIPELLKIEKISDDIKLDSFNTTISNFNSNVTYEEFFNIIKSYEKMLKRLKDHSDLQTDFVNSASHELKTPIFILKNYSSLLKKSINSNPDLIKESIDTISSEINNMEKLVEKLLFLSRCDSKPVLDKEKINLLEIINDVIQEMNILYPNQIIHFQAKNYILNSNWILCKQVLRNIVENAIKYGNDNPVEIILSYNSKSCLIYVIDHGVGISKDDLPFLFNKFFKANNKNSEEGSGYGLGLPIVKSIISSLNGRIFISSVLGKGTTVKIFLKD